MLPIIRLLLWVRPNWPSPVPPDQSLLRDKLPYYLKPLLSGRFMIPLPVHEIWTQDFLTRRVLLQCDSTWDLYPVTAPTPIPHVFLVSQHMWHQRLGHLGGEVLRRLVSNNIISCNKEKPLVLCHAFQLGKHVRRSFVSSSTIVTSCFDIVHSDVWTSPITSLS
nr:ribonuclease H-like domain-containing protein [Tanacetum cinerariifolium]